MNNETINEIKKKLHSHIDRYERDQCTCNELVKLKAQARIDFIRIFLQELSEFETIGRF